MAHDPRLIKHEDTIEDLKPAIPDWIKNLKRPEEVAKLRGKEVREVIKPHSEVVAEQAAAVEAAAVAAAEGAA